MNSLTLIIIALIWFYLGYRFYGSYIERKLVKPDDSKPTPAVALNDNVDYSPAKTSFLWGHHFASIAGAGPIIGPILAVSYFGWGITALWITIGSVFMGAVHDYLSLMLSVRNKGQGIAEVAGISIGNRTRVVFAILIWLTLVFIITVFAASGAKALVAYPELVIPTFGMCIVAIGLGLAVYRFKMSSKLASIIAIAVVYVLIWVGFNHPLSLPEWLAPTEKAAINWMMTILFIYCAIASVLPVWFLLQPRDFLSSVNLFVGLALGVLGVIIVHPVMNAPFHIGGFMSGNKPIWPLLFIIVACGAISGFHTMVATGTTSKQLARESCGKVIGFGGMIMEGVLAFLVVIVVSAGLMWGTAPAGATSAQAGLYFQTALGESWILAFGNGFGNIVGEIGIPGLTAAFAGLLGATMVKTFVMTSLDTSTRLGRFVFVETFAKKIPFLKNRLIATMVVIVPAFLLAVTNTYSNIWRMFGASNQLIAAIALITISAYLAGKRKPTVFTFIPAVLMSITTIAALLWGAFNPKTGYLVGEFSITLGIISILLIAMAAVIAYDGMRALIAYRKKSKTMAV